MHIVFLLPGHGRKPIGGHKVVYEYANRLLRDGHNLTIIYGAALIFSSETFFQKIYTIFRFIFFKLTRFYTPFHWFDLENDICLKYVWQYRVQNFKNVDRVIATSVETAISLINENIELENQYYFIQGFEDWNVEKNVLIDTWRNTKFKKIFISDWLKEIGDNLEIDSNLVYNGFDISKFYLQNPVKCRDKYSLCTIYHRTRAKGFDESYQAIKRLKIDYPNIVVNCFGTEKRPAFLPEWFLYKQLPEIKDIREIYNKSSIFIASSYNEGWGLTIGEAMLCGCAVVCTNNKGHTTMAINNHTALTNNIKDIEGIYHNVVKLIECDKFRFKIALNSSEYIKRFNLENSYMRFKEIVVGNTIHL